MIEFKKGYTRDMSLITEEAWYYGQSEGVEHLIGQNPHSPINIYYVLDGAIEVWEQEPAMQWLAGAILKKNQQNPQFLHDGIVWYKKLLAKLEPYFEQGQAKNHDDFQKLLDLIFEASAAFVVFYTSAMDDRTPHALREQAMKVRYEDSFFDDIDLVIRNSIVRLYPALSGAEAVITRIEIGTPALSHSDLINRRRSYVLIPGEYAKAVSLEQFCQEHPNYHFHIDQVEEGSNQVKGMVASPGKVIGKVRVIRRKDQIGSVQAGEIIVSPMTTPDYLPAMKLAVAFVTDEGGITCHAAIVARELKKPCIIGTKVATQVFKNGDLVEVDATHGVVKIITKKAISE